MPHGNGASGPSFDAVEVVTALYRAVLRREPDEPGLEKFVADLRSGAARPEDVAEAIVFSKEAGWTLLNKGFLLAFPEMLWEDRRPAAEHTQLCFMHVMKTGGTSLTTMLGQIFYGRRVLDRVPFVDQLIVLPPVLLDNVPFVSGHLSYEAVRHFFPRAAVCTVVRDPLDRALSHFAHLQRDELVRQENPDLTLEEFIESPHWQPIWSNYQARYLVHRIGVDRAWSDYSPPERLVEIGVADAHRRAAPLQALFDTTPLALDGPALEKAAVEALESIEFVGVTERLQDTALRVAERFGADPPAVSRENVAGRRLRVKDLPGSVVRRLKDANTADYACYEYARGQTTAGRRRFFSFGK